MDWLTDARKNLIVGTFTTISVGVLAICVTLWTVAALAVGSVVLIERIGGWS